MAGRVSWPDGEFRASESVAVSGRPLAGPEGTGDQGSRQVRICQRVSSSRPRLDGTAFRTRCRAWRTTCPAIAYRRCRKVPARLVRHSGGSDSRIRTGRLQAMTVRHRHPALARMEKSDLLKLYRGRTKAIDSLQKLHEESLHVRKGEGYENELHALLKDSPWLVNPECANHLTSNSTIKTVCS
ncbi:MAG: hypothetical protein OXF20_10680 [Gammaproteobacteria bacterium]|nr:hypothetical protein [Gammaproteobacteria bacterium]